MRAMDLDSQEPYEWGALVRSVVSSAGQRKRLPLAGMSAEVLGCGKPARLETRLLR